MDYLGGAGDDSLVGVGGNDRLFGYGGKDTLVGGAGNDTLNGGVRQDSMVGGDGDDTYYLDRPQTTGPGGEHPKGDIIVEFEGGGSDTLVLSKHLTAYTLFADGLDHVENLVVTYVGATQDLSGHRVAGQGNGLGNSIWGGNADSYLTGLGGDDHLYGEGGDDWVIGGQGSDTVEGGAGVDRLDGNEDEDVLVGQGDADQMTGGAGIDTFLFTGLESRSLATITDLDHEETIDVSALGATRVAAFDGADDLEVMIQFNGRHHDHVVIAFDSDGDQVADYLIKTTLNDASFDGLVT